MHSKSKAIIDIVKDKPELRNLDEAYIQDLIKKHITEEVADIISELPIDKLKKKKTFKQFLKAVRSDINYSYGMFKTPQSKRFHKLLQKLKSTLESNSFDSPESLEAHKAILKTHKSTKERLAIYPRLYKAIFSKTGDPESILDLGSGLNPCSLPFMNFQKLKYNAVELSRKDADELNEYFDTIRPHTKIKGSAKAMNLLNPKPFPKADITFMFKILDVLEAEEMKVRTRIFPKIKSEHIVVSFSTETLNQNQIKSKRNWFQNYVRHEGYKVQTLEYSNEKFFILER